MRVSKELKLSLSVAVIVLLASVLFSYAQQQDTAKSSVPVLTEVEKRFTPKAGEKPKEAPALSEVEKRFRSRVKEGPKEIPALSEVGKKFLPRERSSPLTPPQLSAIEKKEFRSPQIGPLEIAQLPEIGWPEVREFKDFRGGLDLSTAKTKVPPNRATYLMNALWNEQGEMYKRPGFDTLVSTPEEFNFLYRYYQQDGDKYLMGGSDTALYFWQEDSSDWTWLAGTGGTSGRWDGTTYEDVFVGTHLGTPPVFWDGDSILSVTILESPDSFYVEWSTIVMDTVYTDCYRFRSVFTLTSPPASFETNELIGYTFEWYKHAGSSEIQRMLVLSNTADEITTTLTCSLDLVPDKPERWCWVRPWFQSTSVDSGTTDSVTVCYDDPDYCCFRPGDYAPSVRFWDSNLDTTKLGRDWTYIFAATDSRGNLWRNYIGNYSAFGVTGGEPWVMMNGWMVACFDEATEYEIYRLSSVLEDEGAKFVTTFDDRLWIGWGGTGVDQEKNVLIYSNLRQFIFPPDNEIFLTPGDGDYITGMISLSDARYVDVPTHLLMVTKNASSYKIVPTSTAGLYDSWYISTCIGCVSNSAMAVGEGLVLFPDQSGVWAWDQRSKPRSISLLIDPIFEAWDISNLEYASAVYNPQDRHYYLSYPPAASDSTIFIVWEDDRAPGLEYEIYGQRYSMNLDTLNTNFAVNDDSPAGDNLKKYPSIDMNAYGYSVVVWTDDREGDPGAGHVYCQRYNNSGGTQGVNFRVCGEWSAYGQWPSVAIMPDNSFMVVWTDYRCVCEAQGYQDTCPEPPTCPAEDHHNLFITYGQAYSSGGAAVGANFQVVDTDWPTTSVGEETDVASNYYGSYVAVWEDGRDANGVDIYGQRLTSAGRLGSNFKISDYDGANAMSDPRVTMAQDGGFVVCWHDQRDGNHAYCQIYDSSATKVGVNFRADSVGGDGASMPDVSMNPVTGDFVVTWIYGSGSPNYFTYPMAQRYLADGSENGDSIWVSMIASGGVENVRVVMDEDDEFMVAWLLGAGNYNVYLQCFCSDGSKHGDAIIVSTVADLKAAPELAGKFDCVATSTMNTFAYNIDYHGWSEQSFSASAYCYQHGLTDTVKVIFAESGNNTIQNYDVQPDDEDDPVILIYQSPYLPFVQNPSWEVVMSYATLEAFLDTGEIYVYWYKDYSELVHVDTITCSSDCREEIQLPPEVAGHNISMKIVTGSEIEDFTLSGYWWEYLINRFRL